MFTKILTSSLLFLIAIGGFFVSTDGSIVEFSVSQVSAAAGDQAPESDTLKKGIDAFNAALGVLTVIVSPAVIFAGWLMSPDWTSGDLFGLRQPMHDMWVVVSNIVYFVYAILLIIIAVATILGKENFNYKVMLPKLALGILMVPFTWWFVQWTISLASIVTASTISIPMEMIREDNRYINGNYIPRYYITKTEKEGNNTTMSTANGRCNGGTEDADICTNVQEILNQGGGIYSPLLIYAYQVFRLQDYKNIEGTLNQIKTAGQLLNNIILGAIMFLVFGILVIALIMILFVRAIKLWMYAMFSPLFTLHFVAGKELFKDSDSFSLKEFVGLCFMPAIVGITLSFGLMVISVLQSPTQASGQPTCTTGQLQMSGPEDNPTGGCQVVSVFGNQENTISRGVWPANAEEQWSMNVIRIAGLTYVYKGRATNANDLLQSTNHITGGLSTAGGIFGTIIVNIIALVFIWMAFMAAKGVNKAISKVLDPFEQMGKKVGDMAMSAPKYAPLPIPGGSISGATKAMDQIAGIQESMASARYKESGLGKFISSFDSSVSKLSGDVSKLVEEVRVSTNKNEILTKGGQIFEKSSGAQIKGNTDIKAITEKFIENAKDEAASKNTFGTTNGKAINVIANADNKDISMDDKKILIAAIIKGLIEGREIRNVEDAKGKLSAAKAKIDSAGASTTSSSSSSSKEGSGNRFTATQQGESTSSNFTINLGDNIKFDANIKDNQFSGDIFTSSEGKKKLEEFMKSITEKDFINEKPDRIGTGTWSELIKKMKNDGRNFKSE